MFYSTLSPPEQTMRHNGNLGTYFWQKNKLKLAIGYVENKFSYFKHRMLYSRDMNNESRRGGLEVEPLLHKLHESVSVGLNPARRQKNFLSNSNTTGGALVNKEDN